MSHPAENEKPALRRVDPADTRPYRSALGRFASGVTVVTAQHEDGPHGMTANAFMSVSLDPPLVLVSVGHRASMHRILQGVKRYGISVLAEDQEILSNHFGGRPVEGLKPRYFMHEGVPLLEGALAHFVVDVVEAHPVGDHTLYIGRVEFFEWRDDRPLLFGAGKYLKLHPEHSNSSG